jgi:hypothetical protein
MPSIRQIIIFCMGKRLFALFHGKIPLKTDKLARLRGEMENFSAGKH